MLLTIEYNRSSTTFNNIEIGDLIGEGSTGKVYKIKNKNNKYVIKIFKKNNRFEYDFYKNFINEISNSYMAKSIGYPVAYGVSNSKNKILIFNLYNKFDLNYVKGFSTEKKLINLIYDVLKVEIFLEEKLQCVNLDIKLNNIMMDEEHNIKIIDLGLIKQFIKGDMFYSYKNYFAWPVSKCLLTSIPVYSTFILISQLFIDLNTIKNKNNLFLLKILKNTINYSNKFEIILTNLFSLKHNSEKMISLINKYYY